MRITEREYRADYSLLHFPIAPIAYSTYILKDDLVQRFERTVKLAYELFLKSEQ